MEDNPTTKASKAKKKAKKPPRIRSSRMPGCHTPKEANRRVVQRHIQEVRFCYERGLAKHPEIEGRVSVKWTITGVGQVKNAKLASSTLKNKEVEDCIVKAVQRWSFPHPCNGEVTITYPFMLRQPEQ